MWTHVLDEDTYQANAWTVISDVNRLWLLFHLACVVGTIVRLLVGVSSVAVPCNAV